MIPTPTTTPPTENSGWASLCFKIILAGCALGACIFAFGIQTLVKIYATYLESMAAVKQANGATINLIATSEAMQAIGHLVNLLTIVCVVLVILSITNFFHPKPKKPTTKAKKAAFTSFQTASKKMLQQTTMKSSNSIKSTIFKAVQKLDPHALLFHGVDTLSEEQTENLLTVADHAVMAEMREAASGINDVPPHEFVDYAAEHSRTLLNYLSIRAILCGEMLEDDDLSDIGIF